jgi:hypothetical protein
MELLKNLEGLSADEQMSAVVELQKAAMKHLEEQKQASIGKSAEMVILGLKKIKSDFEAKFDSLNYDIQTKVANLKDGQQGLQGPKGEQGDRGLDGYQGKDGRDGKDGKDGTDGVDGVGVTDAKIDFDGSLVITLSDGREINVGEVVPVDVAEKIRTVHNIQSGSGGDSQTVLDAIAALQATIATYGTMATQNANNVAITGGTINNTTVGATTPSTGVFTTLTATGQTSLGGAAGSESFRAVNVASANRYVLATAGVSGSTSTSIGTGGGAGSFNIYANGGSGVTFTTNGIGTNEQLRVSHTASAVNYVQVTGGATTKGVIQSAQGSDSNISYVTQSKGTGAIDLAAGSSGVNISNGGTVTAITRTFSGSGYTSFPSIAISAPTTAGGVQAVLAIPSMTNTAMTVQSGGTGYTVGNVLTVVGGTGGTCTVSVTAVSAGVVTAVGTPNFAQFTVLPTNPAATTGGTGSGCTLNLTYGVTAPTITNAGSGYVEQPTVTFSGGGGSGAAAYARVGGDTSVKGLGTNLDFYTPNSSSVPAFRISDIASADSYYRSYAPAGGVNLIAQGATNANAAFGSNGTGTIFFTTNGTSLTTQMRVAHTASAVNYVQVTGAATGGAARISTQGSDSLVGLGVSSKGGGDIFFQTNGSSNTGFIVKGSTTAVNYLQVVGSTTGFGPVLSAQGSDTNIPAVVQPKGTGALQAQQTDSTATGGNARGANAVDWQTSRNAASQVASGQYAFLGSGYANSASGPTAVVVSGTGCNSTGFGSFVGSGNSVTASGLAASAVGGQSNTGSGYFSFVGGGQLNSTTSNSAVTTQSGTMNGTTAVTLSGSNASIKVGQLITGTSIASYTYVAAISGTSLTLSQAASGSSTSTLSFYTPHGVVVGGGNNQATGSYSFIGGGGDAGTAANRNVASGDWSVVGGGWKNTASGLSSFIGGGGTYDGVNGSGNVASGIGSFVASGWGNNASSNAANAIGVGNVANGQYSTVIGYFASAKGIIGNTVFGANSAPLGQGANQSVILVLAKQTTDATATVITSDGAGAGTTNQVILPNNSAYYFRGEVVSGVTGGGNTKGWTIEGVIKRGANAASTALVGTPTVTSSYADAGASTWTIAVTADTTNGGLKVTFTGQASTTIRTVCQIRTTEMTY